MVASLLDDVDGLLHVGRCSPVDRHHLVLTNQTTFLCLSSSHHPGQVRIVMIELPGNEHPLLLHPLDESEPEALASAPVQAHLPSLPTAPHYTTHYLLNLQAQLTVSRSG